MNKKLRWRDLTFIDQTQTTLKTVQSICLITLTLSNADPCSWTLSLKLRTRSTPLSLSEEAAVRVFVAPVPWILTEDIILPVSALFQKRTWKNRQFLHLCSCLCLRILSLTCLTSTHNINLLTHSSKERVKRNQDKGSTFSPLRIENYSMASTNVYCALVANPPAPPIGGIHKTILGQQSLCKPIDGSSIQETSTPTKDSKRLAETWSSESAIKLDFAPSPVLKDSTQERLWDILKNFTGIMKLEKMQKWILCEIYYAGPRI